MRFLVDGYNVTKRDPATVHLPLEQQREALVSRLAVRGAELLGAGEISVVFDGVAGAGADFRRGQVEVRFSRDEPADDLIARLACAGATVVTSDTGLAARVRGYGAEVADSGVCFEARKGSRRRGRYPAASTGLPPGANKVTEELKKLWLDGED
ncbi:MAG: hypothetical protein EG823_03140 [Actinobacteria bacterium]|nr:hypothetical protein [Actinomycetota bacterium]